MRALEQIDRWPVEHAAAIVVGPDGVLAQRGGLHHRFRLASISKLLVAYAALIAVEEGSLTLDEPAGPPGATVRHLLAHAAGYGFDEPDPIASVGSRRIYSNTGIERFGDHFSARSGVPVAEYLAEAVFEPLAMGTTALEGSPAHAVWGTATELARFAAELLAPTLVSPPTLADAVTVQFPGLAGVLPGFGRQASNDWGLGFEIRDGKTPHWTGTTNSPATFGHFGGSGTFLWIDPVASLALLALADREFGEWAIAAWPPLSDAVLAEATARRS